VYHADLQRPYPLVEWAEGERLLVIGPDNLDSAVTPRMKAFLGGSTYECLAGISSGDRLFIIAERDEYLHRGYVMFGDGAKKLLDEPENIPLIGYCYTAPSARGRGIYRRALIAEMRYLQELGYKRVVVDTHPKNHASRKGIEAAGFMFVRTVKVWIIVNLVGIQRTESGHTVRWRIVLFW
jgi:GNAT superfamily N-acetyltransferase